MKTVLKIFPFLPIGILESVIAEAELMYVCLCKAIAEQQIRDLIAQGVCQVRDVQRACSAGSDCGTCIATIKRMLHDGSVSLENAPTTCHPNKNIK